jgi:hypothetical protein
MQNALKHRKCRKAGKIVPEMPGNAGEKAGMPKKRRKFCVGLDGTPPPLLSVWRPSSMGGKKKKLHHSSHIRLIRWTLPVSRLLNRKQQSMPA